MLYSCVTSLHNPELHPPQSAKPSLPAGRCANTTITRVANIIKTKQPTFVSRCNPPIFTTIRKHTYDPASRSQNPSRTNDSRNPHRICLLHVNPLYLQSNLTVTKIGGVPSTPQNFPLTRCPVPRRMQRPHSYATMGLPTNVGAHQP